MRRTGRSTARPNPARSPPGDTRPAGGRGTAEGRADGDDSRSWVRSGWARRSVSGGSAGCGRAFCPAVAELPTWAPRSDVVIPGRSLASRRVGPTLRSNANRMGCRRVFDGMSLSGSRPSWPAGWPPVSTSDRHGSRVGMDLTEPDIARIREQFDFDRSGRVVTNNAASTQPPRQLLDLHRSLTPFYENVHRGQSDASKYTTDR